MYIFTRTCNSWPWKFAAGRKSLPPTKILEIPLQLLVSVEAYLYVKNLTCSFESVWIRLTSFTWSDLINVYLCCFFAMQKTNFITQLIFEIKLTHYLLSIWACSGVPGHTWSSQIVLSTFWTITQEPDFL